MGKLYLTASFADVAEKFQQSENADLAGKRVVFIPTASLVEEYTDYVADGREALEKLGLKVSILEISTASKEKRLELLEKSEYIYVTGGNTFYLMQELKRTGTDQLLIQQIKNGKTYIGESAGSIILAKTIEYVQKMDDDSKAAELNDYDGLNQVDIYPLPHYQSPPFTEIVEDILAEYSNRLTLMPIRNTEIIKIENKKSQKI